MAQRLYTQNDYVLALCREDQGQERLPAGIMKVRDVQPQYYLRFGKINTRLDGWYAHDEVELLRGLNLEKFRETIEQIKLSKENLHNVPEVERLIMSGYEMQTWYYAPFPQELQNPEIYCCEFCLNFMSSKRQYQRHLQKCSQKCPPGNEIYRDSKVCVFEVDGAIQKNYCRNISYIARLFLLHKTLEIDVDIFYFYVMYAKFGDSYKLVGYFSKEKPIHNILSCILTLPCYQGKGYGSLLIDAAYMLCSRENNIGSPEKPLSDLGYLSFMPYWQTRIIDFLSSWPDPTVSIADIAKHTLFTAVDICDSLRQKGIMLFRSSNEVVIYLKPEYVEEFYKRMVKSEDKAHHYLDSQYLHYWPVNPFMREWKGDLEPFKLDIDLNK
ncbi:Histone acetyltransferase [Spironucleus salmonicida]|uniref:Histone acetyltransferase n=1 Tax=Spironucleus salmonicida TaxID=348837 RepID=V6LKL9_9EUKA|nr:Histone acetyltransferase [Spironucleus salmonicida]|eukprot:EST45122.1 Histone acetyltransferase MYST2 [Spironucleus salmonicida]